MEPPQRCATPGEVESALADLLIRTLCWTCVDLSRAPNLGITVVHFDPVRDPARHSPHRK